MQENEKKMQILDLAVVIVLFIVVCFLGFTAKPCGVPIGTRSVILKVMMMRRNLTIAKTIFFS